MTKTEEPNTLGEFYKTCPICACDQLKRRSEKLRDTDSIGILECIECSHVFLDNFGHIDDAYFSRGEFMAEKPFIASIEDRLRHYAQETEERARRVAPLVVNKRVLDFGCGAGALIERLSGCAKTIEGVEPTEPFQKWLKARGVVAHRDSKSAQGPYDVILIFHVLEHLPDPIASLTELSDKLAPGGQIYIEVPHVNDALLSLYEVDAATKFLFFSDHLHYFTRRSLEKTIGSAGLDVVTIAGHNRFGVANHLHWLVHGKPGGHVKWRFLETQALAESYAHALAAANLSDSLIAVSYGRRR